MRSSSSLSVASFVLLVGTPLGFGAVFWACFAASIGGCLGGCIDQPVPEPDPVSTVYARWDPLACGEPHRVVIDLEDDNGAPLSKSVPCNRGGLTLGASHFGRYRGRIYAWVVGEAERSEERVELTIDTPVVHWQLTTPL